VEEYLGIEAQDRGAPDQGQANAYETIMDEINEMYGADIYQKGEHVAILQDAEKFEEIRELYRKNNGVRVFGGTLKGKNSRRVYEQRMHFNRNKWTGDDALNYAQNRGYKVTELKKAL
jgi:hypothetical protein